MSNLNTKPSDAAVLAAVIDPDANTASAYTSVWVNMGQFDSIQAIILAGQMGTSATIDAKLQQATDDAGAGAKDISGKAIAQLVKATDDDKQAIINCRSDELDVSNSFSHVALVMTVGTATSDSSAIILGHNARHNPATALSSVAEVVA